MKYYELDKEEQELLKEYERGEWRQVRSFAQEKAKLVAAARNTLNKTKNINLRISQRTLSRLKAKAIQEGIPYQTLASSVLHKYVTK